MKGHAQRSHSSRALALEALRRWRTSRKFADVILGELLARTGSNAADRAFAQELFYGVLRNLRLLDFWTGLLRQGRTEPAVRDILRLGFYQLFLMDTAEHAAVFETVELAARAQRSLVNAVLRSGLRSKERLLAEARSQSICIRYSHPRFLVERWEKQFGETAAADLCRWNNEPAPLYARINRLKTSVSRFLEQHPQTGRAPGEDNFVRLARMPEITSGECYMQDPSTACACEMLSPQPGERVLDACAAPGGKTAYLAEMMENRGEIVACDRSRQRIELLRNNLARLGVHNTEVRQHDWREGGIDAGEFDRILLDAPCSNTGVMRRRVDVRWRLRPDDLVQMPELQRTIARNVIPLLKRGGVFVYSTCSLEREENEDVLEQSRREFAQLTLEQTRSVLPYRDGFDGAFAARFRLL